MTSPQKLLDRAFPLILAVFFLCLMAQVRIDLPLHELHIPITGQSLAVLLVGYFLGKNYGLLAVGIYLLLGASGAPVFANGASGWEVFTKGSGGFLYGFLAGAWVMGWFREREWGSSPGKATLAMTAGTAVILLFGLIHLSFLYGMEKALEYGFYPFWQGALVKIMIGALLLVIWHRTIKSSQ